MKNYKMSKLFLIPLMLTGMVNAYCEIHYLETHQAIDFVARQYQEGDGYKEVHIVQHEKEQFLDEPEPDQEESDDDWWINKPFYEEDNER